MTYHFDSESDIPAHFWRWTYFLPKEWKCKGTGSLLVDEETMDKITAIRRELGKPMVLTNGYRSPAHNARIGGVKNSFHTKGLACDVACPSASYALELIELARKHQMSGIGHYPDRHFVHLDNRDGPPAEWFKPRAWGE